MILNVSGRTDIVAFFSEWFINRYKEGFVDVRNPFYNKLISRIYFSDVKAIFFCTKNPLPIIPFLKEIKQPIIFHVTLTGYKEDIEPNVKDKDKIIEGIKEISKIIGSNNVFVRYDPIFLSEKYNIDYHKKAFERICFLLNGYVKHIVTSFIDDYKNMLNNKAIIKNQDFTLEDYRIIGKSFSEIASLYNMTVQTCFEEETLVEYGFIKGECLSKELAYSLTGSKYKIQTARKGKKCKCVKMADIGVYNTCKHLCKYCYANFDEENVERNIKLHNPLSSLLIGELKDEDEIRIRKS